MPTYLVQTKSGPKGPYTLQVILMGLEVGKIKPTTTLQEVETGRPLQAGELIELPPKHVEPVQHSHHSNPQSKPKWIVPVVAVLGASVVTLALALLLSNNSNTLPESNSGVVQIEPAELQPKSNQSDDERLAQIKEEQKRNQEKLDKAEKERRKPFKVNEFIALFKTDSKEARKANIGKMLLFEGYIFPFYGGGDPTKRLSTPEIYLTASPVTSVKELLERYDEKLLIRVEISVFHDKVKMIDPKRKVLLAGRLIQPRRLDKADWEFND